MPIASSRFEPISRSRCTSKVVSLAAIPLGFCRLTRAYLSRNLDANSLSASLDSVLALVVTGPVPQERRR
jgi:hypothetical protein